MKVTRYPQSCLLLEKDGHRVVIDPGMHFLETHQIDELDGAEAVLYTHQHPDHYEPKIAEALLAKGVAVYANAATAELIGADKVTTVADGQTFSAAGFEVVARELPHCLLPDGSEGPQNTGYVVDGIFFDPGDGKDIDDLQVANMALPITGPDISMLDAFNFAEKLGVKVAIPVHYRWMGADADTYKQFARSRPFEVRVLADGETTEIE
ncbi:MAG TPA: MBL fold metallo-hydrolase [Candidatus Saccharimonadales bacterium]|nr:MBL fold metallo-hydrolase [Candidatus Saccharimonadales bacterium]